MIRGLCLATAACLLAAPAARAKTDLAPGNYVIYSARNAAVEQAMLLIKVERKGDKDVAEVLESPPETEAKLEKFDTDGKKVLVTFDLSGRSLTFDGTVSEKDPKVILGSFGDDRLITRGRMAPTDKDKLTDLERPKARLPGPMQEALKLNLAVTQLRFKLRMTKDEDQKADLKKQVEAAQKAADEKTPALYQEVIEKHADGPAVVDAALALLPKAQKASLKPEAVGRALKAVDDFAAPYGPRYRLDTLAKALDTLANQKGYEAVALEYAEKAGRGITDATTIGQQARVLKVLHAAQLKAGKTDVAKQTEARLAKIEAQLDKAYLEKVPPFKPAKFAGRQAKSERVAVMELFTGAQCPPCVAADVAFDALLKAYQPTDLVLIQYHMHIPGPDPLTNPDSEARFKYYGTLRGTPSTLFNGKVLMRDFKGKEVPSGGGGMAQAEAKFQEYQKAINPSLEQEAKARLSGSVRAEGGKLAIKVVVGDVKEPNDNLKLRVVLVEDTVKYVGGNGLRFHHHVVRAMPGGPDGTAVKARSGEVELKVDLAEVRKELTAYLDKFAADNGPFPNPDRPMALENLRVIAFVQDDSSKEILQAVQLSVPR